MTRPSDGDLASDASLSPSIEREQETAVAAFEQKFLVDETVARAVLAWARARMIADHHADPADDGAYRVATLYLDTPAFDVFHRAPELDGSKCRLRRYGDGGLVYVEKKTRRGDRVRKRRTAVPLPELARLAAPQRAADWPGEWFHSEVLELGLRPVCWVRYRRTAFFGAGDHGPFRLTLDREIRGRAAHGWADGAALGSQEEVGILADRVVCELKFRDALPRPFKELVAELALAPTSASKYRRIVVAAGLAAERNGAGPGT